MFLYIYSYDCAVLFRATVPELDVPVHILLTVLFTVLFRATVPVLDVPVHNHLTVLFIATVPV